MWRWRSLGGEQDIRDDETDYKYGYGALIMMGNVYGVFIYL